MRPLLEQLGVIWALTITWAGGGLIPLIGQQGGGGAGREPLGLGKEQCLTLCDIHRFGHRGEMRFSLLSQGT